MAKIERVPDIDREQARRLMAAYRTIAGDGDNLDRIDLIGLLYLARVWCETEAGLDWVEITREVGLSND